MRSAFFLVILAAAAVGSGGNGSETPAPATTSSSTRGATAGSTAAVPASKEWVEFNGQRLVFAFEGKNPVEILREYIPTGEKLDSWTQFAAIHEYPAQIDPMVFARTMADALKKKNPAFQSAIHQNDKTGEVMIDFVMWPADTSFIEFNVFRLQKKEGGGIVAQQYAVRAYEKQMDFMKGLAALRAKLLPLMGTNGLTIHGG